MSRNQRQQHQAQAPIEERLPLHAEYLEGLSDNVYGDVKHSLAGSYIIECPYLNLDPEDLTMDIEPSCIAPGIFECHFNLSEHYGTMIIGSDESEMTVYRKWLEKDEKMSRTWVRNGVMPPPSRPQPAKFLGGMSLDELPRCLMPRKWFIQWRSRESGEDMIDYTGGREDFIVFTGSKFIKFQGLLDFGRNLGKQSVFGYKTAPWPLRNIKDWSSFSKDQYEFERRDRWRR
ncbi:hypothetical protein F5X99DRAFT_373444, partial [Biscogniauxia marginata]